jgi:hypothetical protein
MYKRLGIACVALAVVVAACSGTPNNSQPISTPPLAGSASTATLGASQSSIVLAPVGGVSGSVTFPTGGTGTVSAALSAAPPAGTVALSSVTRAAKSQREVAASANTPIAYVTISSASGATFAGIPAFSVTIPTAPVGTALEAQWTGAAWQTVGPTAGGVVTTSGNATSISFLTTNIPTITIAPGGALNLAVYTGGVIVTPTPVPTATPTPGPSPTNMLADPGFESGNFGLVGTPITAGGWTQCFVTNLGAGIVINGGINGTGVNTNATPPPLSTFPIPAGTPAAKEATAGTVTTPGTGTPIPTQGTVITHSGTRAAVFGDQFNNFNPADFAYNGLCQQAVIPANGASLTGFVFETGNETSAFVEDLVGVMDSTGKTLLDVPYMENISTATVTTDTGYRAIGPISLSKFSGQTVTLFIGMWTKAGSTSAPNNVKFSSFWFVDDLTLLHP